jgi:hypothetical protein
MGSSSFITSLVWVLLVFSVGLHIRMELKG